MDLIPAIPTAESPSAGGVETPGPASAFTEQDVAIDDFATGVLAHKPRNRRMAVSEPPHSPVLKSGCGVGVGRPDEGL